MAESHDRDDCPFREIAKLIAEELAGEAAAPRTAVAANEGKFWRPGEAHSLWAGMVAEGQRSAARINSGLIAFLEGNPEEWLAARGVPTRDVLASFTTAAELRDQHPEVWESLKDLLRGYFLLDAWDERAASARARRRELKAAREAAEMGVSSADPGSEFHAAMKVLARRSSYSDDRVAAMYKVFDAVYEQIKPEAEALLRSLGADASEIASLIAMAERFCVHNRDGLRPKAKGKVACGQSKHPSTESNARSKLWDRLLKEWERRRPVEE